MPVSLPNFVAKAREVVRAAAEADVEASAEQTVLQERVASPVAEVAEPPQALPLPKPMLDREESAM